jgi:hypothetical protein
LIVRSIIYDRSPAIRVQNRRRGIQPGITGPEAEVRTGSKVAQGQAGPVVHKSISRRVARPPGVCGSRGGTEDSQSKHDDDSLAHIIHPLIESTTLFGP